MTRQLASLSRRVLAAVVPANAILAAVSCGGSTSNPQGAPGTAGGGGTTSAVGGTAAQAGSAGGLIAGSGGALAIGGAGGSEPVSRGGTSNYNCRSDALGTCCDSDACYSPEEAWSWSAAGTGGTASGDAAPAPQGGEPSDVAPLCPTAYGHSFSFCSWIQSEDVTVVDGKCCYVVRGGGCCGRPFVVEGVERRSGLEERADWCRDAAEEERAELPAEPWRDALCDAWARDATMEHASVASFGRFALELLANGAPASLVEGAHRAALDEIEHARHCFALASRFGERELGPGPLEMHGIGFSRSLSDLAVAVLREGCIGETLAAALAREQLSVVEDAQCRAALEVIARDEAEHALMAWRFLRYAVDRGGADVVARLQVALAEAPRQLGAEPSEVPAETWHYYGRLTEAERRSVVAETWSQVILPAMGVLGSVPSREAHYDV